MGELNESDAVRRKNAEAAKNADKNPKPAVPSEVQPHGDPAKGAAKVGQESQNDRS